MTPKLLGGELEALGVLCGVPGEEALAAARLQARGTLDLTSLDPLDSNLGLYWIVLLCPLLGEDCRRLTAMIEQTFARHRFVPHITCAFLTGRAALINATLYFDREDAGECARALECHHMVIETAIRSGYPPARTGIEDMAALDPAGASFWDVVRRIKDALDPAGIVAPGRYAPWQTGSGSRQVPPNLRSPPAASPSGT